MTSEPFQLHFTCHFNIFQSPYSFKNQVTLEPFMEESINHFPLCKNLDVNEECIVDAKSDVFDPILIINHVSKSKKKLDDETSLLPNFVKP